MPIVLSMPPGSPQEHDPDDGDGRRAHTGPDCIGGADRDLLQRLAEQRERRDIADGCDEGGPQARDAFGVFQRCGGNYLGGDGKCEHEPGHNDTDLTGVKRMGCQGVRQSGHARAQVPSSSASATVEPAIDERCQSLRLSVKLRVGPRWQPVEGFHLNDESAPLAFMPPDANDSSIDDQHG